MKGHPAKGSGEKGHTMHMCAGFKGGTIPLHRPKIKLQACADQTQILSALANHPSSPQSRKGHSERTFSLPSPTDPQDLGLLCAGLSCVAASPCADLAAVIEQQVGVNFTWPRHVGRSRESS